MTNVVSITTTLFGREPNLHAAAMMRSSFHVELGPIVGHTTHDASRIWVRARDEQPLVLRYGPAARSSQPTFDPTHGGFRPVELATSLTEVTMVPDARRFGIAQAFLDRLEPDTRYFYEVVPEATVAQVDNRTFVTEAPCSFATLPTHDMAATDGRGLCFAFLSCNGLHRAPRGRSPTAMWARALQAALADPCVKFAIFGGDQIYADHIRDRWTAEHDPRVDLSPGQQEELLQRLRGQYARTYVAFWARPEIRLFMAHLPCVMTWDDHDIYDGWGSHGDESLPAQQVFFRAAAEAFDAHQMIHNPDRRREQAGLLEHRGFHFRIGRVGYLVLDLRTVRRVDVRSRYPLLGEQQWDYVQDVLDEFTRESLSHLVVVTSVPPAYADRLAPRLPQWVLGDAHDDLLDQWSSPPNVNDRLRLFGRLLEFRRDTGANVLIVGGDVHIAGRGSLRCEDPRFLRGQERVATMHQLISSAIGHAPPTGVLGWAIENYIEGEQTISQAMRLEAEIASPVRARNFAIVSAVHKERSFWAEVYAEGQPNPLLFHFPGSRASDQS